MTQWRRTEASGYRQELVRIFKFIIHLKISVRQSKTAQGGIADKYPLVNIKNEIKWIFLKEWTKPKGEQTDFKSRNQLEITRNQWNHLKSLEITEITWNHSKSLEIVAIGCMSLPDFRWFQVISSDFGDFGWFPWFWWFRVISSDFIDFMWFRVISRSEISLFTDIRNHLKSSEITWNHLKS